MGIKEFHERMKKESMEEVSEFFERVNRLPRKVKKSNKKFKIKRFKGRTVTPSSPIIRW